MWKTAKSVYTVVCLNWSLVVLNKHVKIDLILVQNGFVIHNSTLALVISFITQGMFWRVLLSWLAIIWTTWTRNILTSSLVMDKSHMLGSITQRSKLLKSFLVLPASKSYGNVTRIVLRLGDEEVFEKEVVYKVNHPSFTKSVSTLRKIAENSAAWLSTAYPLCSHLLLFKVNVKYCPSALVTLTLNTHWFLNFWQRHAFSNISISY